MRTFAARFLSCLFPLFIAMLGAIIIPDTVRAHAVLIDSTPKDKAVLTAPPREVILRFNARIEQRVAQLVLVDGTGRKLALPAAAQGHGAARSDRLVVPLPPLGPGSYQLQYRILATDGHATPGLMRFTVVGRGAP